MCSYFGDPYLHRLQRWSLFITGFFRWGKMKDDVAQQTVWAVLFFFNTNSCVAFSNICNFFDCSREGTVQCFKGNDADLRPNRLALYSGPPRIHIISLNKHWTYGMPKWYLRINLLDNCHANYIWQLLQNQIHICYSCDVMTNFKLATAMHFWLLISLTAAVTLILVLNIHVAHEQTWHGISRMFYSHLNKRKKSFTHSWHRYWLE